MKLDVTPAACFLVDHSTAEPRGKGIYSESDRQTCLYAWGCAAGLAQNSASQKNAALAAIAALSRRLGGSADAQLPRPESPTKSVTSFSRSHLPQHFCMHSCIRLMLLISSKSALQDSRCWTPKRLGRPLPSILAVPQGHLSFMQGEEAAGGVPHHKEARQQALAIAVSAPPL